MPAARSCDGDVSANLEVLVGGDDAHDTIAGRYGSRLDDVRLILRLADGWRELIPMHTQKNLTLGPGHTMWEVGGCNSEAWRHGPGDDDEHGGGGAALRRAVVPRSHHQLKPHQPPLAYMHTS